MFGQPPRGEKSYNATPRGKSPMVNMVSPRLIFFIVVNRFSGFRQVKIAGKSESEINEIRGRRENMICVRTIIAAPKGSA